VFSPNPGKRPAVKDLLSEPWLQSSSLTQADITKVRPWVPVGLVGGWGWVSMEDASRAVAE
jgi:hypothetical protein